MPTDLPTQVTNPTVPVPPVAPFAAPGPPHAPVAPPYGAPGGPHPFGTAPGAPQFSTAPGAPLGAVPPPGAYPGGVPIQPDAPKKSRAGLVIALLVLLLLVVGGIVAFLVASSGSDLTTTIDTCTIDADGALGATGEVTGTDGAVTVAVEFRNADGDEVVDAASTSVQGAGSWDVSGSAPDDVQRVTCVVTKLSE